MSSDHKTAAPRGTMRYRVASLAARPDLLDAHQKFGGAAWPEFMLHDPVPMKYWGRLMTHFADYQLSLLDDDDIAAVVNMVPLRFDGEMLSLPDRGVDWGVERSVTDFECGASPNALMGMQVVVGKAHRGTGLSDASVQEMIRLATERGLKHVLLPVRPNGKHRFPLIPMEDYIAWTDGAGNPYDAWLHVHLRLGGEIVRLCPESMIVPGTIADWSRWTGLEFPGSGQYLVPGAPNPIEIDLGKGEGIYREPNVWVVHRAP